MYIIIPGAFNATTQIAGGSQQGQIVTVGSFLKVTEKNRRPYPSDTGIPSEIWIDNTAGVGYVCKESNGITTVWDRLDVLGDFVTFGDSDPGVNTDIRLGYRPGSLRYARNSDTLWICSDNTQGSANWNVLSSGSSVVSVNGQTGVVELYLDDLLDVDAPTPSDGDVLTWDSGTSKWIAAPPSGGGGTYTVDNGLTANTLTNFQLGGGIIQSTTITAGQSSSSHGIRFDAPVNLPTGSGIYNFTGFDLLGLYNSSGNSILGSFNAQGAISLKVFATESSFDLPAVPGTGLFIESQDIISNPFKIKGTIGDTLLFNDSGQLRLHKYDSSTSFASVSGTSVGILNVDNLGRVFVGSGSGGSGTVTSVGAGTGMSFTTIITTGNISIDTATVPYIPLGFSTGLLKWDGSSWVFDNNSYITSSALTGYVQSTRAINTTKSITGGGDLSTDRTLELVNDDTTPGNLKYYGTDSGGTKGFHSFPSGNYAVVAKSVIAGTVVTGTGNGISAFVTVPANTFAEGDVIRITWGQSKVGTAGSMTARLYVNTTNSLTGAIFLAQFNPGTSPTTRAYQMIRHLRVRNATTDTQYWLNTIGSTLSDIASTTSAGYGSSAINHTVDQVYIFALQNSSNGDSLVVDWFTIERL